MSDSFMTFSIFYIALVCYALEINKALTLVSNIPQASQTQQTALPLLPLNSQARIDSNGCLGELLGYFVTVKVKSEYENS